MWHSFSDWQGVKKYFKYGLSLEVARSVIYNYPKILRNPLNIFHVFLKRLNWNLVMFLPGYVGIYRVRILFFFSHFSNKIKPNATRQQFSLSAFQIVVCKLLVESSQYLFEWETIQAEQSIGVFVVRSCFLSVSRSSDFFAHSRYDRWDLLDIVLRTDQNHFEMDPVGQNQNGSHCISNCFWVYVPHSSIHTVVGASNAQKTHAFFNKLQVIFKCFLLTHIFPRQILPNSFIKTIFRDADIYTSYHGYLFGLTPQFILWKKKKKTSTNN